MFFIGLFVAILSSAALISCLDRLCYHTESLWVPSQEPKVEFWLGFLTSYIEASISSSTLGMEALSEMRMGVVGFSRKIGITNSFVVELWGLRDGLIMRCSLNLFSLEVEVDAKAIDDCLR